jgi:hypothetical protein
MTRSVVCAKAGTEANRNRDRAPAAIHLNMFSPRIEG